MSKEEIFDMEFLMLSADNDAEWANELFNMFFSDTGKRIEIMEKMIDSSDFKDLTRHIHTIKGTAGSVGAVSVKNCAIEMESMSKEGHYEAFRIKLDELKNELKRVSEEYKNFFLKAL